MSLGRESQEFLKYFVRKKLALARKSDLIIDTSHQTIFLEPWKFLERRSNKLFAEFLLQFAHLNPRVEAQAEEPCFLMLTRW